MHSKIVIVFITVPGSAEARDISRTLVEQKKAACVNIMPGMTSLFWWEGKIDNTDEHLLMVKTSAAQLNDLIKLVKLKHPYKVPEIIAVPVIGGNDDYLNWIEQTLK